MTITFLVTILLLILALAAGVWFCFWLLGQSGMPDPMSRIIRILICVVAFVIFIAVLFPGVLPIR